MFKFIRTSETGVFQTFGKFTGTKTPGLVFYIPGIQSVTSVSNRLIQDSFSFTVKTRDDVFTKLEIAVQHKIEAEDTEKAFFSLDKPKEQIDAYIENIIRAKVPKMRLEELFESQDEICSAVAENLKSKMKEHGYTIVNTLVTKIDPANEVKDAMNKKKATEFLKEAAKNEADADYIKKVREAEADRDRKKLQGEGMNLQRLEILKGYGSTVDTLSKNWNIEPGKIKDFVLTVQKLDVMSDLVKSGNTKVIIMGHGTELTNSMIQGYETANKESELK